MAKMVISENKLRSVIAKSFRKVLSEEYDGNEMDAVKKFGLAVFKTYIDIICYTTEFVLVNGDGSETTIPLEEVIMAAIYSNKDAGAISNKEFKDRMAEWLEEFYANKSGDNVKVKVVPKRNHSNTRQDKEAIDNFFRQYGY